MKEPRRTLLEGLFEEQSGFRKRVYSKISLDLEIFDRTPVVRGQSRVRGLYGTEEREVYRDTDCPETSLVRGLVLRSIGGRLTGEIRTDLGSSRTLVGTDH